LRNFFGFLVSINASGYKSIVVRNSGIKLDNSPALKKTML